MPNRNHAEAMSSAKSTFARPRNSARARLPWSQWFGWLGLSAGATLLVGALAIWAATETHPRPKSPPETPWPTHPFEVPASHVTPASPPFSSPRAEPRRPKQLRPRPPSLAPVSGSAAVHCDGRDPLCGIDFGAVSDVGTTPHKPRPR